MNVASNARPEARVEAGRSDRVATRLGTGFDACSESFLRVGDGPTPRETNGPAATGSEQ